jgi:UDP-N-acetyl-D-mannosaminouronate:lipid I N-acetyl-D-mannosaminouronosyltransferase
MQYRAVNGLRIYAPSSRSALIEHAFAKRSLLVAVNAEKILHATNESREIVNRNIGYPDGIGAVLGLRKKGVSQVIKIPGCELWLDIVRAHYRDKRFYLVGGQDEVIEETVSRLMREFSGIQIVNYRNGYLRSDGERQALVDDVVATKPDVVFVAMGSPKQELLMEEMARKHPAVYQGLGGSFDVYTGRVERAPPWWVQHHLEWFYRLIMQPSRIKRQVYLLSFLWRLHLGRF